MKKSKPNYFKPMKKSEITTKQACRMVFLMMPEMFTPLRFCNRVREILDPYWPMDGTILRRLRELKNDDPDFNYRYVGGDVPTYKKWEVKK